MRMARLACIPMRATPSHKAELVNEMLFGETADVRRTQGDWLYICLVHDGYEGWVHGPQLSSAEGQPHLHPLDHALPLEGLPRHLPPGSLVPMGPAALPTAHAVQEAPVLAQKLFLDAPYRWGGRTPLGIDCSGLVQVVLRLCGHALPRDAHQQAETGTLIDFVQQAEPGDLAFFGPQEGAITHVGICMGNGRIIHASASVRIDALDQQGIFSTQARGYTHELRFVKRLRA